MFKPADRKGDLEILQKSMEVKSNDISGIEHTIPAAFYHLL